MGLMGLKRLIDVDKVTRGSGVGLMRLMGLIDADKGTRSWIDGIEKDFLIHK